MTNNQSQFSSQGRPTSGWKQTETPLRQDYEGQVGLIPEGWDVLRLDEVLDFDPSRPIKKGDEVKFIAMTDIDTFDRKIKTHSKRNFDGGSKFKNGDTLMARITPCLENGKTAYCDILDDHEVAGGSTEFIVLSGKENVSDSKFVYYLSTSPEIRNIAIQAMVGSSGRQRVQADKLKSHLISFPPIKEQQKIAEILGAVDEKIELNRKMNKTLEQIGQAIFKRWFVDLEETPKGWEESNLDKIANFLNGLALQKHPPENEVNSLPVIKIKELKSGVSESSDKASSNIPEEYIVNDGDVLFSWSGSLEVVLWSGGKGALNQHLFKITSKSYPKWFYYYWTKYYLEEFQTIAAGKATTMGHIQRRHLSEAEVLIPDKSIMDKLDSVMTPVTDLIINNSVENETLSQIRDSLLPRLMSGKLRVG